MPIQLINAQLVGHTGLYSLDIDQDMITALHPQAHWLDLDTNLVIDLEGDWLSLGGVDLQINGALGLAFPDLTPEHFPQLEKICEFLWHQGVDAFLPTLVTTSLKNFDRALSVLEHYCQEQSSPNRAKIWGVHLEGPFLNPEKCGAHPPQYLLPLTLTRVQQVLGDHLGLVKIITLAPELDPSDTVIPYLVNLGIQVSVGHSQASAEQAQSAFDLGASLVTHAFNAMPSLHHRQPGLLGAALYHSPIACGLIADGKHVDPLMLHLLLQRRDVTEKIFLVSDALAPLGLSDGHYPWDDREIEVSQGTARLLDGTLSGTTLSLLAGVKNLLGWKLCPAETAIALATESPRRALGQRGLAVGSPATLLRWHDRTPDGEIAWQRLDFGDL